MMWRKAQYLAAMAVLTAAAAMADAGDPPSRVARLNYQSGPVSFRPGSVEEWTAAAVNFPLTTGDHLWTDDGGRTEMHVGSTGIRMASQTAMSILNLDDHIVQFSLTEGSLNVHLRYLAEDEAFEVDTPNVAVSLLRPGEYRISFDGDHNITMVVVRSGQAEITGAGSAIPVRAGQSARITGDESPTQDIAGVPPPDGFDRWCEDRDRREERSESARYVSREMIGYEDLDEYGAWRELPEYGWVWAPRTVVAGWAPYHYGRWAWVEPWGWTWVDDAPWGFAPFHYGRWAFVTGGWFWVPGTMVARPVYAPALVAFVGGPRFGVGAGIGGGVAWFPLGPHEVYRPAYHVSDVYVRQVNITHVTNVTVINNVNVTNVRYVNQNVQGAVMAVPHEAFVSARPVHEARMTVNARDVAQAQVVGSTAPIAPQRQSVLGPAEQHGMAGPPARYEQRRVVARSAPPPPPVSFAAKQQELQANPGRPLDASTVNRLRTNAPPREMNVRRIPDAQGAQPGGQPPTGQRDARPVFTPRDDRPQRNVGDPVRTPPANVYQPVKPVERNVDQPARPVERRVDNPPIRPAEPVRPVERRVDNPPNRPAEPARPVERRIDNPPIRPAEPARPVERRIEPPARTVETPARQVERNDQPRSERPTSRGTQQKAEKKAERKDEKK